MKAPDGYAYSGKPTRNPFRYLLALWRSFRDLTNTEEVAIVEIGLARTRLGRRLARWEGIVAHLEADPRTAPMLGEKDRFGPIDLETLARLPAGTLGRVYADHCRARSLNPNLVHIPGDSREDRMLDRLYATHDVWHVATGWGNDDTGEVGLGAFYLAQLEAPFFTILMAVIFLNTAFLAPHTLRARMDALVAGYAAGRRAEPLFGADWHALWATPLSEVRHRLGLEGVEVVGEGILAAA